MLQSHRLQAPSRLICLLPTITLHRSVTNFANQTIPAKRGTCGEICQPDTNTSKGETNLNACPAPIPMHRYYGEAQLTLMMLMVPGNSTEWTRQTLA